MIHVEPKAEPAEFDQKVRAKGIEFLNSHHIKDGKALPSTVKLPAYWTNISSELARAYGSICAYLGLYVEPSLGGHSVDHFLPKSKYPWLAYEWKNYRFSSLKVNKKKRDKEGILDPFDVQNGWFCLNVLSGELYPNPAISGELKNSIESSIERLGLNDPDAKECRFEFIVRYLSRDISEKYLRQKAPIVWVLLTAQGLIRSDGGRG